MCTADVIMDFNYDVEQRAMLSEYRSMEMHVVDVYREKFNFEQIYF